MKRAAVVAGVLMFAYAHTSKADELLEKIATVINLNGHLCASVTDVRPLELKDVYEVTCVEYRGGSGEVRYIMNARQGSAFKAG